MTYTEPREQGKGLAPFLVSARLAVVRLWLRFFGPRWTLGVMVILTDNQGRICLLKHKGRLKPWAPPGGLLQWPEAPELGLRRELREELAWVPAPEQSFSLYATLLSERFPMLELVFRAERPLDAAEVARWQLQKSEITDVCWLAPNQVPAFEGILERHRSLLVGLLHRP